jgi:flagellar hook-associated protein 1 FlgK
MGGLLSSLTASSAALNVFSRALGTEQNNVANASTPGYAAQTVSIRPLGLAGNAGPNGDFIQLSSADSSFSDAAVRAASAQASESHTQSQQLSPVNQLFDITGSGGILAALQQFGTAFSGLSVNPNDSTLGAAAINAASNVALAFQSAANSLNTQRTQLDSSVQGTTAQINALASQISQLNVKQVSQSPPDPAIDAQLRSSLDQLSSLVDVTVTHAANGSVSVLAGGQLPLVIGDRAYQLSVNPAAVPGSQVSSSAGGNSSVTFSGQLGGLLGVRNGTIGGLLGSGGSAGSLNTLAAGFASRVNALLTSGVTSGGAPGVPLFTFDPANPQNAAATLAVDPTVTAAQLGVATGGVGGQANGTVNALAALAGSTAAADQIGGLSAEGLFGSIAASVGQSLSDANTASTAAQTASTSAQANRQQQIGVSLDQEAVNITADERAYQANAQVVSILNQLTQVAVDLIK